MKNILKFLILFYCSLVAVDAKVTLHAPSSFITNEPYYFTIEASGEDIVFPKIDRIDGFVVEQAGQSSSISSINGQVSSTIQKRYRLLPTRQFVIPSFEIRIDDKTVTTQTKTVVQQKIKQTKNNLFEFNLLASKTQLYVGEQAIITLQFKHRKDIKILDFQLNFSSFENFWHKQVQPNRQYEQGDFLVQELDFVVFAQKSGSLNIEPISLEVVIMDAQQNALSFFTNSAKRLKVYSNKLNFVVQPLPQNTNLIGMFNIQASVDKVHVQQGESINYKLRIEGEGNMDDIQAFTLEFPNATVYANKPNVKTTIKKGRYQGVFTQSFSIIANESMRIPPLELSFFDQKTQQVKTIQSKAFDIQVDVKAQQKSAPTLQKAVSKPALTPKEVVVQSSRSDNILFFILGVITTLLSIGLYFYVINKKKKTDHDLPLQKRIKGANNKEALLFIMLPYVDYNEEIQQLIFALENALDNEFKLYKKRCFDTVKKYKIKG